MFDLPRSYFMFYPTNLKYNLKVPHIKWYSRKHGFSVADCRFGEKCSTSYYTNYFSVFKRGIFLPFFCGSKVSHLILQYALLLIAFQFSKKMIFYPFSTNLNYHIWSNRIAQLHWQFGKKCSTCYYTNYKALPFSSSLATTPSSQLPPNYCYLLLLFLLFFLLFLL